MRRIGEHWNRLGPCSRFWLAAAALCAFTVLAYANSFAAGLVLDNGPLIAGDQRIHHASSENLALIFAHSYWWPAGGDAIYRPITTLSYLFNYAILGDAENPVGYHWINVLLHAANVLLVFALAKRLVSDVWPSFLIAAVWAVHPVLTESVTNIVGRADLLSGMTILGGLLIYLRSTESDGWRKIGWLAGLLAVTGLGVFCKESAVAVLPAIVLYEVTWRRAKRLNGLVAASVAMAPAFLFMWWARSLVLAESKGVAGPFIENPISGANFWIGRLTAAKVIAKYLGLLIWPANLSADYSYAQIPLATGRISDWLAWIVLAAVVVGVAFLYSRSKPAFFAVCFAFVTLFPASNLVIPVGTIMAERFLYLPAIGYAVCLILAVQFICARVRADRLMPAVICVLIACGFAARTWARNKDWTDDYTFWTVAARTSPLSFKTHIGLARAAAARGEREQAIAEGERAVAILDTLAAPLILPSLFYVETGVRCVEQGDHLVWQGLDGKVHTPPESVANYQKARALLVRGASIIQSQRAAEGARNRPSETPSPDVDRYIKQTLAGIEERLARTPG